LIGDSDAKFEDWIFSMTQIDTVVPDPRRSLQLTAFRSVSIGKALVAILALSVLVLGFLVWLVYFRASARYTSAVIAKLPAVNATFNALSTVFLILGYVAIKQRREGRHMKYMFAALTTSALFFVCYVVYHGYHGDTKFAGQGAVRPIYFFILITHIVLSAVVVPMILTSFFTALGGRFRLHRKVSVVTFPIWLYVSVTGVAVFVMLKIYNG
jgi:putative membrane protein